MFIFKIQINKCIINDDNNNDINAFFNLFIFSNFNILQDHSKKNLIVLAINHIWRYKFLKILYTLATSPITHCKIISCKNLIINIYILFIYLFAAVDGIFYVCNMVKIHHKKTFNYMINIFKYFFKNSKNWIRFITI